MNIYKIQEDFKELMEIIELSGGEITPDIEQELIINEENFLNKTENYLSVIKSNEGDISAIDEEIKRLTNLKRSKSKTNDWLKGTLAQALNLIKGGKYDGGTFKLSVRHNKSVELIDEALIPDEFKTEKVTISISKTDIKKAIESGQDVKGASLVESVSLQIR